jgi:hypothetical protein
MNKTPATQSVAKDYILFHLSGQSRFLPKVFGLFCLAHDGLKLLSMQILNILVRMQIGLQY